MLDFCDGLIILRMEDMYMFDNVCSLFFRILVGEQKWDIGQDWMNLDDIRFDTSCQFLTLLPDDSKGEKSRSFLLSVDHLSNDDMFVDI